MLLDVVASVCSPLADSMPSPYLDLIWPSAVCVGDFINRRPKLVRADQTSVVRPLGGEGRIRGAQNPDDANGPAWVEERCARDVSAPGRLGTWIAFATTAIAIYFWIDSKGRTGTFADVSNGGEWSLRLSEPR